MNSKYIVRLRHEDFGRDRIIEEHRASNALSLVAVLLTKAAPWMLADHPNRTVTVETVQPEKEHRIRVRNPHRIFLVPRVPESVPTVYQHRQAS